MDRPPSAELFRHLPLEPVTELASIRTVKQSQVRASFDRMVQIIRCIRVSCLCKCTGCWLLESIASHVCQQTNLCVHCMLCLSILHITC